MNIWLVLALLVTSDHMLQLSHALFAATTTVLSTSTIPLTFSGHQQCASALHSFTPNWLSSTLFRTVSGRRDVREHVLEELDVAISPLTMSPLHHVPCRRLHPPQIRQGLITLWPPSDCCRLSLNAPGGGGDDDGGRSCHRRYIAWRWRGVVWLLPTWCPQHS